MDNNVATLCFLAIGVGLLILLAAFLLVRLVRGTVFGLGMMVMRMISEPPEEPTKVEPAVFPQNSAEDLRAKAQALDFDAAVAKYREQDAAQVVTPPDMPPPNPPVPPATPQQGFPPPDETTYPTDNNPLHRQ